MQSLPFPVPFTSFAPTTFFNCFASVYVYLEKIRQNGRDLLACIREMTGALEGQGSR